MNTTKNHFWGHFVDIETNEFLSHDDITYLQYKMISESVVKNPNHSMHWVNVKPLENEIPLVNVKSLVNDIPLVTPYVIPIKKIENNQFEKDQIHYAEPTKGQVYTPHLLEQAMIKITFCVITAIYVFNI